MASTCQNLFVNLKREKLLTISNIAIMTVTFLLFGVLVYVVTLSQTAIKYLERQAQVTVFFKDTFTEPDILSFRDQLKSDGRVLDVKYISKSDAFKIFRELNKDEPILLESLSEEILPASLEIKTIDVADLSVMAEEIAAKEGVEEVRFFESVVSRFIFWSNIIYVIGTILVILFLLISYSVVMVTLRTTINSKGLELEIMKLVGASDSYVKRPLIYQGIFYGLVSSFIAGVIGILVGLLMNGWTLLSNGFSLILMPQVYIKPVMFSFMLLLLLIVSGVSIGYLGSYTAVKKYLKY